MAGRQVTGKVEAPDDATSGGVITAILSASSWLSGAAPQPLIHNLPVSVNLGSDGSFTFPALEPNAGLATPGTTYRLAYRIGSGEGQLRIVVPQGAGAVDISTPGVIVG